MKLLLPCLLLALLPALTHADELPPGGVWLDDLDLSTAAQDWEHPRVRASVEGAALSVGGKSFRHGVGAHARFEWRLALNGTAQRFVAQVGVDDEKRQSPASLSFEVWGDRKKLYDSGLMHGGDAARRVDVSLAGIKTLRLVIEDGGNGVDSDHGDWGDAYLVLNDGAAKPAALPASDAAKEPTLPIWQGQDSSIPAIHGPRVVGATPGRPFLFRIPATGQRPLRFATSSLPAGLTLDPSTGIISGALQAAGTRVIDLTVTGPKGTGRRKLAIVGGQGKLALTPPLGWNSWNVWAGAVDEARVRAAADQFIATGLADHGFAYVNIDDCWQAGRDSEGRILSNERFPDMKALTDYVHARGLKIGTYSSPGPYTCAGFTGSFGYEYQDARSWAEWGFDYIKYDWCSYGGVAPTGDRGSQVFPYKVLQHALDAAPRDIVYSLCQYGMSNVSEWGATVNGNCWRTTGDITDTWASMSSIGFGQAGLEKYAAPGRWNDPDMLVVGWVGWGPSLHPTRLLPNEQITHITLWSLLASPLLIGCDLTRLDDFTKALLLNDDVLDVNQDPLGKQARRVAKVGQTEVWARPLFDGTTAVGLFNRDSDGDTVSITWKELGLSGPQPVRDLWQRKDVGLEVTGLSRQVPGHGALLFKVGRPKTMEYDPSQP